MARTAWHALFFALLKERRAAGFSVSGEVPVSHEPQRADIFLLRRPDEPAPVGDEPTVLPGLWSLLPRCTLGEFKSHARPLRRGEIWRLLGYVAQYVAGSEPTGVIDDFCALLIVASSTPTLRDELAALRSTAHPLSPGYTRYLGPHFPLLVVSLRELGSGEQESVTRMFSNPKTADAVASRWLRAHTFGTMTQPGIQELEGYDEVMEQAIAALSPELRLKGLKPEDRLAGLTPEQRLAGLDDAHAVLALPASVLRALSTEYIEALPDDVKAEVKRRLAEP